MLSCIVLSRDKIDEILVGRHDIKLQGIDKFKYNGTDSSKFLRAKVIIGILKKCFLIFVRPLEERVSSSST